MAKLDRLTLRVKDPDAQRKFYCDILGMSDLGNGRVGYSGAEVALDFVKSDLPYHPLPSDLYWKIAISVPNIELAASQLAARGVQVTEPVQFRDVGFLAKATDPEGFVIELIDHHFAGERPAGDVDETLLGGGPHLSLITLRTGDIASLEPDILAWGMKPLSVQSVAPFGFTLYFYGFTDECPPNPDLEAIENRCWTYQRPYSVLEIQHVHGLEAPTFADDGHGGFVDLAISGADGAIRCDPLRIKSLW